MEEVNRDPTTVDHNVLQPPLKPNPNRGRTTPPRHKAGDGAEHPQPLRVSRPREEARPHSGHSRTNPFPTSGIQPRLLRKEHTWPRQGRSQPSNAAGSGNVGQPHSALYRTGNLSLAYPGSP